MDYFKGTKIQISPCVAAKVKFALNLTKKKPTNTKKCSHIYWCRVIKTFSFRNNLSVKAVEKGEKQFKFLIK